MVPRVPSANGAEESACGSFGGTARRDYVFAVVGLFVTVAGLAVLYPLLIVLAAPMQYLAVTALVGGFVVVWLVVWTCIEALWVRRRREPTDP